MELPLVERELGRHTKAHRTYVLRMAMGGLASAVLAFFVLQSIAGPPVAADTVGRTLANVARLFQFGVAVLLPPLLTAGLIATERHERTLGLLMLADFRGWDVFSAKLLSPLIYVELLILGALPILAFSAFFGGIQLGNIVLQVFLFSVTAFAGCAFGLMCSALARKPGFALFAALLPTLLSLPASVAPQALLFGDEYYKYPLHPAMAAWTAMEPPVYLPATYWVPSFFAALVVGGASCGVVLMILPRLAYDPPVGKKRRLARRRGRVRIPRLYRKAPLSLILSRGAGGLTAAIPGWPLRILASLSLIFVAPLSCIGPLFLVALMAYDILSSMETARRSGIYDDLRLTAPEPRTFVHDIVRVQFYRSLFYFPAVFFASIVGASAVPMAGPFMVLTLMNESSFVVSSLESLLFALPFATLLLVTALGHLIFILCLICYVSSVRRRVISQVWSVVFIYFAWGILSSVVIIVMYVVYQASPFFGSGIAMLVVQYAVLCALFALLSFGFFASFRRTYERYV